MTRKRLEEDFRRLGLSEDEIRESMPYVGEDKEADVDLEDQESDFEDDAYLSDLVDDEDDEELDEGMRVVQMQKMSAKEKRKARQRYKKDKAKIARTQKRKRKTAAYKRRQAKLAAMPKAGGIRKRRIVSDVDVDTTEGILESLSELAESVNRDPVSRFDEYVEAFNHIADLGELAAMRVMDDDEDAASDLVTLSLSAEAVLQEMEDLGGALSLEEDEMLEEALAQLLEDVGDKFDTYGLLSEEEEEELEEEELEDDDNPFLNAANSLREAKKKKKNKYPDEDIEDAEDDELEKEWGIRDVGKFLGYLRDLKAGRKGPSKPKKAKKAKKKKGRK